MALVLKADGSAGDALVEYDFASPQTDLWVTLGVFLPTSLLASAAPGELDYGPDFVDLLDSGSPDQGILLDPTGAGDAIGFQLVYDDYPAPFSDPLNDETWIAVEMHAVGGTPIDTKVYVEGSLERDDNPGHSVANWEGFTVGIRFAAPDSRQVIYIRQVKVGTTRGGSEIFEDDFSGGDLSAWSSTSGDVSVVEEPGEGSPAAIHIWKRF